MTKLTTEEVKNLIDRIGPSLGCGDLTYEPIFPRGRTDVCAIRRMAENGTDYGYDTVYLVWKKNDGSIHHRKLDDSKSTKDYIHIDSIIANDNEVTVSYGSGGSYSGKPWKRTSKQDIK